MRVYLDNNIFIYIENGNLSTKELESKTNSKFEKIYYSDAHIQETLEINGKTEKEKSNRIEKRLNTIRDVTSNNYIHENLSNEVYFLIEDPLKVLKTVTEVEFGQEVMKSLVNFITEEQRIQVRSELGIDPKRINNYTANEVIGHLKKNLEFMAKAIAFLKS